MQKYNIAWIFWLGIIAIQLNCKQSIKKYFAERQDIEEMKDIRRSPCSSSDSYIPDLDYIDHTPVKTLRLNFHIMQDGAGEGNFTEAGAKKYIRNLIWVANEKLRKNDPMFLPKGNETPVLPLRYEYRLYPDTEADDGIYFHKNDDLYFLIAKGRNRNNHKRTVCQKYGVGLDSILNIFVMANHKDSLESPTYSPKSRGIALGNCIKMVNLYYNTLHPEKGSNPPLYRTEWHGLRNLNHEIGHSLGLRHTWRGNDNCDDTPNNPNCWTIGTGRCKDEASNNVMDYNNFKSAWTPCQIGIIHRNMAKQASRIRKATINNWCTLDEDYNIEIRDSMEWQGAKDLRGNLIIKPGGNLTIRCPVSIPEGGKIVVWPGAVLKLEGGTLYNDCGGIWDGIEIISRKGEKGRIEMNKKAKLENMLVPI